MVKITVKMLQHFWVQYDTDILYMILEILHQQVIGIPMGISCVPLLANLFLLTYEYNFLEKLTKTNIHEARNINFIFRYIDGLICLNNDHFASVLFQFTHWSWMLRTRITLRKRCVTCTYSLLSTSTTVIFDTCPYNERDRFLAAAAAAVIWRGFMFIDHPAPTFQ